MVSYFSKNRDRVLENQASSVPETWASAKSFQPKELSLASEISPGGVLLSRCGPCEGPPSVSGGVRGRAGGRARPRGRACGDLPAHCGWAIALRLWGVALPIQYLLEHRVYRAGAAELRDCA